MDPRHKERMKVIQELFGSEFVRQPELSPKTKAVMEKSDYLNGLIRKYAPKFPIEKIAKVDLAILKLAVYELMIDKKEPPKVIINEAVELAREMGSNKAFGFVNAVLGKVYSDSKTAIE